jgi:hypothetical protein
MTNCPCLRAGCHNLCRCKYRYNTSRTAIFFKTIHLRVRICVYAHVRTRVVLTGGNANWVYFLHLHYAIYYSITMHLWSSNKVSYALKMRQNSRAHPLWGRGLKCPVQRTILEVNMFPKKLWKPLAGEGDVNPGPIPSGCGLLEDNLYRATWTTLSVIQMSHDRKPRAWGFRNVLWPLL